MNTSNILEQKLKHIITCRGLIERRNVEYTIKMTNIPSLFHWHCSRPMLQVTVLKYTKRCEYVTTRFRCANEYVCRNPSCNYHFSQFDAFNS